MKSNIFFTEKDGKFIIPIPEEGFTINEENSEFTDGLFVSWTYPLSLFLNSELKRIFGDLSNPRLEGGKFEISGIISKYGEIFPSKLKIASTKNSNAKINFEFGVASLDVMDKQLKEIDLGKIIAPSIYDYIDENLFSSYPDTPVCFPRIRTAKDYLESIGPLYGGSNVFNNTNQDNNKIYRNEFVPNGQAVFNFIKPVVYLLHILKKGFESAGYELKGDILTDPQFQKIGFDHNNVADIEILQDVKRIPFVLFGNATAGVSINQPSIIGAYSFYLVVPNDYSYLHIKISNAATGTILYEASKTGQHIDFTGPFGIPRIPDDYPAFSYVLPVYNVIYTLVIEMTLSNFSSGTNANNEAFVGYLNPVGPGTKKAYILPEDLTLNNFVPDATFLQVVKSVKTIGNYYFLIENNNIFMNKIKNTLPNIVKDLTFSEQEDVEIISNDLKGYILRYDAPEEFNFLDHLYDKTGFVKSEVKIEDNQYELKEFSAYPLPLISLYRNAADEINEDVEGLAMIHYSGTKSTNNPDNMTNFSIDEIYLNNYKNWMTGRLTAAGLKWSFTTTNPIAFNLKASDCIYVFSQFNKIINFQERHHLNNIIEIEIQTENRY